MKYIVLDACVIGDFFGQFFSSEIANRGHGRFRPSAKLSGNAVGLLNKVMETHASVDCAPWGKIVLPPLGLVEVVRRWDDIVGQRFRPVAIEALLASPPEWLVIASWNETLLPSFMRVPLQVFNGSIAMPVEWTDAIYPATALSYGVGNYVLTSDRKLIALGSSLEDVEFV